MKYLSKMSKVLFWAVLILFFNSITPISTPIGQVLAQSGHLTIPAGDVDALIEAITTANGNGTSDVIELAADATYSLTEMHSFDNGLPRITSQITINGNSATIIRDSTAPQFRILEVASDGDLILNNLTISGGSISFQHGGGVVNGGNLTATDCTFSDNRTTSGGEGGAIANLVGGTLTVSNCTFSNNQVFGSGGGGAISARGPGPVSIDNSTFSVNNASNFGGAIKSNSELEINSTIFVGNTASYGGGLYIEIPGTTIVNDSTFIQNSGNGGAFYNGYSAELNRVTISQNSGGSGGGIYNSGTTTFMATLTMANSTISDNTTNDLGGGIYNSGATLTMTNSTVSGNSGNTGSFRGIKGGGIYNGDSTITLINSTVSGNTANFGGGIFNSNVGIVGLQNTILALNTAATTGAAGTSGPDCSGAITTLDYSLISDDTDCALPGGTGNRINIDPLLGSLQDNSGPTFTHALLAGSPAIDAADNANCPATDQRGLARPVDGDGDGSLICDMGAFEANFTLIIVTESLPLNKFGEFSSHQFEAIFGDPPYSWSLASGTLPPGMNFSSDGILSGTPTEAGSFTFTVRVTDNENNTDEETFEKEVLVTLPPSEIRVQKWGSRAVPGRVLDYFILMENVGDEVATDVKATEFLEPWFTLISASPTPSSVTQGLDPFPVNTTGDLEMYDAFIMWNISRLEPGEVRILSYKVTLDSSFPLGETVTGPFCLTGDEARECRDDLLLRCFPYVAGITCLASIENPANCVAAVLICEGLWAQCIIEAGSDCGSHSQPAVAPLDPNEKGVIANKFIQPDQTLVYPIHFENIGDIEALDVFATDVLDPSLDASTVEIITPGGTYDSGTRTVKWDLLGINLPPEETDEVFFSIKPLPGLPSGTEIRNSATIQFEVFETITTNETLNIIDGVAPTCTMNPLPSETSITNFTISWSGTDAIGEIESYTIFVAVDGGGFTPYTVETADTSAVFNGEPGRDYEFICIAKDTAGNVEIQSSVAETVTTVSPDALPVNQPPLAEANGPYEANEGDEVIFSGFGSFDPDGTIVLYEWDFESDGVFDFSSTNLIATHVYPTEFSGTVTLRITDNDGSKGVDTAPVEVRAVANQPPLAEANGPYEVNEGGSITLDASSSSDPDGAITLYEWDLDYDGVTFNVDITGLSPLFDATNLDGPDTRTVALRVTDDGDITSDTATSVVTINNVDPSDIGLSLDAAVIDENGTVTLNGSFDDPGVPDEHTVLINWGDGNSDTLTLTVGDRTFSTSHLFLDDDPTGTPSDNYTINVSITDDDNGSGSASTTVTVDNVAPEVETITVKIDDITTDAPVIEKDSSIEANADFNDPGTTDTHTAVWDWGDDSDPTVIEITDGSQSVSGSHTYATPGVYAVRLTVTDDDTGSDESIYEFVVVYDPDGGFVTGGGWIDSPSGAYVADPSLTGKATFGFVSKYKKGANVPTGETEFQFRVADLNFHSDSYDWLVVAGPKAMYKGTGTINGAGTYDFMLSAIDENLTPSTDVDLFRIKIWDKDNGDALVYDNQIECSDDADDTDPCTGIEGGNIVIHKGK